ncbi:MAG: hypothetical protein ACRDS9_17015 [Pseudonocardiaceae bacterium]
MREEFIPDVDTNRWRPGLRIKRVQGIPKMFEMTWAADGRATWEFRTSIRDGVRHMTWRRAGTHDILTDA